MYCVDYHVHTTYSDDAQDTIKNMTQRAIQCGIREIAFTDHVEINEGGMEVHGKRVQEIYEDVLQCRSLFCDKIKIRFGLELGQGIYDTQKYHELIKAFPYDFLLSSIHRARGQEDYYVRTYTSETVQTVLAEYVNELDAYIEALDFDVFGHIDLPARYLRRAGLTYDLSPYEEQFVSAFRKLVASGRGIELNISGLRDGWDTMPTFHLLKRYRESGGEIITIGSDSHRKETLGQCYKEGIFLLQEAGFRYLTVFENRKKKMVKL